MNKGLRKKKDNGPDLARTGPIQRLPAQQRAGAASRCADRRGPSARGTGGRNGMEPPGPSDLVKIDGPGSSPTSGGGTHG
jgi:hypothetical protein